MGSFFLPNWSPPDDPARPLPAEGRPWPSDDDDDDDGDDDGDDSDDDDDGYKCRRPVVILTNAQPVYF